MESFRMRISESTINALQFFVIGGSDGKGPCYRSAEDLVSFFYEYGSEDIYSSGFPSRKSYAIKKLREYNGTDTLVKIIEEILEPQYFTDDYPNNEAAVFLNKYLKRDGYKLVPIRHQDHFSGDEWWCFNVRTTGNPPVEVASITRLENTFIDEQIDKAKKKLAEGDYDGAITNARSLVEAFLKEMIAKSSAKIPKYDGDLLKLYKVAKQALNLDPSQKALSDTLKQVPTGLISIVNGISGLSNKMGDRHSPSHRPRRHHARLAVNAAFTFCEFLLESYEYQQSRKV